MSLRDKYTKEEWIELEKLVFKKAEEKSDDSSKPTDNIFLLDEIGQMPRLNKENLWEPLVLDKPGIKFEYPEINEDMANSWNILKNKMNTEMKQSSIINQMTNKILEKKANGIIPEVAIISMGDYDEFHKTIPYTHSHENNSNIITSGIRIAGVTLLIYPSPNIEDGNIKIY